MSDYGGPLFKTRRCATEFLSTGDEFIASIRNVYCIKFDQNMTDAK